MSRRILIKPVVQTKLAYLVFTKAGSFGELAKICATRGDAEITTQVLKELEPGIPHISHRPLTRAGLSELIEFELTEAQFNDWGVKPLYIDGVLYQ